LNPDVRRRRPYVAARRPGVKGWIGFFRATVGGEGEQIQVRSVKLAKLVADLLNGAVAGRRPEPRRTSKPSPVKRYSAMRRGDKTCVIAYAARARDESLGMGGVVGVTPDESLGERVAALLNAFDPATFQEPAKGPGFGWW
jgi:hypothetical protein